MILQALFELHERLVADTEVDYGIAPPGQSRQNITFRVVIDPAGKLIAVQDARVSSGNKSRPDPRLVLGQAKPSGSGINPCLLWDNATYLLGLPKADPKATEKKRRSNEDRARAAFAESRKLHLAAEHEIDDPCYSAVCRFFEHWDPAVADELVDQDIAGAGFGLFQIVGRTQYVHEEPAVQRWWAARREGSAADGPRGTCLVTGRSATALARLHEPKTKGVAGGQSMGGLLVSFNEPSFVSYGKEQSYNAPVAASVARAYSKALNALLVGPQSRRHRINLGDTTVAFWTDRPSFAEDIFAQFAVAGSRALDSDEAQDPGLTNKLKAFLQALAQARNAPTDLGDEDPQRTRYFLLGLSPNAARLSVRFFEQGTVDSLLGNLGRHFEDISIARPPRTAEFPSLRDLLRALGAWRGSAKPPSYDTKQVPSIVAGPLLKAVVQGGPYPDGVFLAVHGRIRADRHIDYLRAGLIKGWLRRNKAMEVSVSLDINRPEPAYRLGRLFAVLEKTQEEALGRSLNATIRERFYGSASASPRAVFPRLLRTYQHHLAKLPGGLKVVRDRAVQEIVAPLTDFPSTLDLAEQGLFAIGYYHQRQDLFTKREDRAQ